VDVYNPELEEHKPATKEDIIDFYYNYNIGFVEELFPFPQPGVNLEDHIKSLLIIAPVILHPFLTHTIKTFATREDISFGEVIVRPRLIFREEGQSMAREIDKIYLTPNREVLFSTTSWTPGREKYTDRSLQVPVTYEAFPTIKRTKQARDTKFTYNTPNQATNATRYFNLDLEQKDNNNIIRRFTVNFTQKFHFPREEDINHNFNPLPINFNYPQGFIDAWQSIPPDQPKNIYTDGSLQPTQPLLDQFTDPFSEKKLGAAIVFTTNPP
jgi:hypothetical protein